MRDCFLYFSIGVFSLWPPNCPVFPLGVIFVPQQSLFDFFLFELENLWTKCVLNFVWYCFALNSKLNGEASSVQGGDRQILNPRGHL